jgi:hypothetical protein
VPDAVRSGDHGKAEPRVRGEAILYRLFDVGYEIRLDEAFDLLLSNAPDRRRPVRGEAHAIQIANPPLTLALGVGSVELAGRAYERDLSARLFDFGVISLRARFQPPAGLRWGDFCAFGALTVHSQLANHFDENLEQLLARITPSVVKPARAPLTEDYTVFRIHAIEDDKGAVQPASILTDIEIEQLLIGERKPLAASTRAELLSPRFSYFEDDLTVLTWNAALVAEPVAGDTDVQYVLEFANAQLLELRFFDMTLDAELPRMYDEIESARRRLYVPGLRFGMLLGGLQKRVADVTESVERVDNALKVTDDVFLARIYSAALEIFRGPAWHRGISRKMTIMRDTYSMLNAEAQTRRSEALELSIVILIVVEIVLALIWR